MKNKGYSILIVFLVTNVSWAQVARTVSAYLPEKGTGIVWQDPIEELLPGIGKRTLLVFENAQYDLQQHYYPLYNGRIPVPSNTSSATVKILDPVYQPLSAPEKAALAGYETEKRNKVSDQIEPTVFITMFRKRSFANVLFVPIRKNSTTGIFEKLVSFSLEILPVESPNTTSASSANKTYASNSVLASGTWKKISVTADGVYKMDGPFFESLGIDPDSIDPRNIRIYGNGGGQLPFANSGFRYDDLQENSIFVAGETDGKFDSTDYVLFYGQSQHRWTFTPADYKFHHNLNIYSDTTYYFINCDLGAGKRIQLQNSSGLPVTTNVTSFDDFQFHELEATNLLKSGRVWLGETFDILTTYNFSFVFPNIETSSKAYVKVETAARRDPPGTDFSWSAGSASATFNIAGVATSNIYGTYHRTNWDSLLFYPSSATIQVSVTKQTPSPAIGWLNYIEVNARRNLIMTGGQLLFRDMASVSSGNVSRFTVSNATSSLQLWDITDPMNVKQQLGNFSGSSFDFTLPTDSLKEFVAFNGLTFLTPKATGEVLNQDLHGMAQSDYIIITNPMFLKQANDLADLHRTKDLMNVAVATTEQVFNEFSSGAQDVSAIRDFVKMFYDRAADSTQLPKYLLLFGRGSYNLKSTINNTNLVPAYESLNSTDPTISYPSDDFYGMLDSTEGAWDYTSDVLDLGVGRLPVITVSDAEIVVDKIKNYTSVPETIDPGNSCSVDKCYGLGDWTNIVTFIADDEDSGDHQKQANIIATKVDTTYDNYNVDKVYFDAYQQVSTPGGERYPDATNAFLRRMDKGSLIINYTGHGGELGWAHERFLEIFHINNWLNKCKLPLFFTATCEFSRWDDPGRVSAGELTLLHADGGSIGLMSTTRVVYSQPNFVLNNYFYDFAFKPLPNGQMPRMGDLQMLTKNSMGASQINHRNFSLLGDPALALSYPEYSVATTEINGAAVNVLLPDTAKALSLVTIKGEVRDKNGSLMTGYNGIIYPTVYDKAAKITTLSNDGTTASPPFSFYLQKHILFKGKASVTNGVFTFTCIIPKDIAYNFGNGRISYYTHNGFEDGCGYFEDFIVGGTDTTAAADATGPEIKLFMNDEKFVFGGITNTSPKIFAVVSDSNGINTAGTSIGHDITAVLDADNSHPIVLNDYYESDLDNYKKGTVRYPLSELSEGTHSLTVKVWDVYNNSSSTYTEFVVAADASLALKHVLNYPNPFTTKTSFFFEHNQCCTNMDVQIQVFTISGKLVKSIHRSVNMEGYRSEGIEWDGTDNYGDKIGRGVYVYRLKVKAASGEAAEQFEKLVILK